MEADWGVSCFTGDDDFDQRYDGSEYAQDDYIRDHIMDDHDEASETYDHDSAPPVKSIKKARSQKRKSRKKRLTNVEYFYDIILSWAVSALYEDSRHKLRLPPLVPLRKDYQTVSQYCDTLLQLPIEESRASLVRGMHCPEACFSLQYVNSPNDCTQSTPLVALEFIHHGGSEVLKPGWILFLYPQTSDESSYYSKNKKRKYSSSETLKHQLVQDMQLHSGVPATLALGKYSFSSCAYGSGSVLLWVHADNLSRIVNLGTHLKAYAVENLISYQRMVSACLDRPCPPFMPALLGQKQATRIRFDYSNDNDDSIIEVSQESSSECTLNLNQSDGKSDDDSDAEQHSNEESGYLDFNHELPALDASQQKALDQIMDSDRGGNGSRLHIVQGPPGCGKTFFLVHLLHRLVCQESPRCVLVCAPSNKAVSVVIEKYRESSRLGRWRERPVLMVGVQDKIEMCSTARLGAVDMACSIVEGERVVAPGDAVKQLRDLFAQCSCGVHKHSACDDCGTFRNTYSDTTPQLVSGPRGILPPALIEIILSVTEPTAASDTLVYTYSHRVAVALTAIGDVFGESAALLDSLYSTSADTVCHVCVRSMAKQVMNALVDEYYDVVNVLQSVVPEFFKSSIRSSHISVINALQGLSKTTCEILLDGVCGDYNDATVATELLLSALKIMSNDIKDPTFETSFLNELLASAWVVCCTLSSAGSGVMKVCRDRFDVLIVDEAGQCLESELLVACNTNPQRLVLIGDPKQLPATVLSLDAQKIHLGRSTMERLMYSCSTPYVMLNTQYRMHADICQFPNKQFYNKQLLTASSVDTRPCIIDPIIRRLKRNSALSRMGNYMFVNISSGETGGGYRGKSKCNIGEADFISRMLVYWHRNGIAVHSQVGIITFYAAQVAAIKKSLSKVGSELGAAHKAIKVMSIDGFQGSEADLIIVSFVRSNSTSTVGFVSDFQRLNVSLTRAKHSLVLVGCAETLKSSDSSDLRQLVHDAVTRNRIIDFDSALSYMK